MNVRKDLRFQLTVIVFMFPLAVALPASAVTHYVSPGQSIQAGINAASYGDTVEVAAGTYNERITLKNGVGVIGAGAGVTIIDGNSVGSVVISNDCDANTVIEGFMLTGGNAASGGGMYNENGMPMVTNCTFSGNSAYYSGGGMYNIFSNPTVTNCTFSGNTANEGGGMYNWEFSNPKVTNCTFTGNSAIISGGGMLNENSEPIVTNSIIWGNIPDGIFDMGLSIITYSDVQGGWPGEGNIDADPCFIDAATGNLGLLSDSPCVDTGNTSEVPPDSTDLDGDGDVIEPIPFDLNGDPRILNGIVDMGACEFRVLVHNVTRDRLYETIQESIDDANDGNEIEVAPWTYYEAINFNGKAVRLYSSGGPEVTTINGNGADHVVQCVSGEDANTILEGFTITGGNATGPDLNDQVGGGMYNRDGSSPTVKNCMFTGNSAVYGGGLGNYINSSSTVTNCTFSGNSATKEGGGMYNGEGGIPSITDCSFSNNTSDRNGGGMFNWDISPMIINCNFSENSAQECGGGVGSRNNSSLTMTNCTFSGNVADDGGGMYNYNSSPTVTNCTFSGNVADNGGGMLNSSSSSIVINCTFSDNEASTNGGGMCNWDFISPTVTNCTFSGNVADNGGGMSNMYESIPTLTNCTFSGNSASSAYLHGGGGMYNYWGFPTVTNCILWGDKPNEIFNFDASSIVTYSDVEGGWPGIGNIDSDPLFVDAAAGNLRLRPGSPCIDAGSNSAPHLPATDIAGNLRVADGDDDGTAVVDMGVFELQHHIHNTTQDTWYTQIQRAIDDANDGDEIEVPPGTYNEAIDFKGKAIRLYSSSGPAVTTIDGTGAYHVVKCVSGEDANTILEGFTITGGNATGPDPNDRNGGGMYNYQSGPTVTNCDFTSNSALIFGGGMYNENGNSAVTNCIFSGNSAHQGGGICNLDDSSLTVTNCIFTGNSAGYGGGMYNGLSNPAVTNCTFSSNYSGEIGGGMSNVISSPTVTNCTFSGNSAHQGGAMDNSYSNPTVTNCTFEENSAGDDGGGMYNESSSPTVTNCTFSGNTAVIGSGGGMINNLSSSPTVTNCTFEENSAGDDGGGICNWNKSNLTVTNCTFEENSAGDDGGGMYNLGNNKSNTTLNCTFSNNAASDRGGGICNLDGSSLTVTNCTFTDNSADYYGGGICNENHFLMVTNCILWGDTPDEIYYLLVVSPTVSYSDVEGGWSGTGNIDADPCFVDADAGNLRLRPGSPCIDAGDNNSVPADISDLDTDGDVNEPVPFDPGGMPRFIDDLCTVDTGNPGTLGPAVVDMGAYEFQPADIDISGAVNLYDLSMLASYWGETACGRCGGANLNCDGDVDFKDVAILCDNWLEGK